MERHGASQRQELIPIALLELQDTNLCAALIRYLHTDELTGDIARKHGYSASGLSYWAHKLGLPMRQRGRRPLKQPGRLHYRVLALVRKYGMAATTRRIGCSRQHVQQIVTRWAPELQSVRSMGPYRYRSRRNGQQSRGCIVCYRVTPKEMKSLASIEILNAPRGLSATEKAREILLRFLAAGTQPPDPALCLNQGISAVKAAA